MNWPLTQSMQRTQEQAGDHPIQTIVFSFLMYFMNMIIAAIIGGVFALVAFGDKLSTIDPETIEAQLSASPLIVYIGLYFTIIMILIVFLFARWFQKRKLDTFGFHKEGILKQYGKGTLYAIIIMVVIYVINYMMGTIESQINPKWDIVSIILLLVGFMIQGMSEEVFLRGYLMNGLASKWGVPIAIIGNSVLFSLLHAGNPGITVLSYVNLVLAGIFFSLVFYITDNMWLTGALHSFWNFVMGAIFGVQVSGLDLPGVLMTTTSKESGKLWNGGSFGFEGGLVVTIILFIVCAFLITKRPKVNQA